MKVLPVRNKIVLNKRLKRFFDSKNERRGDLCNFLDKVSRKVDVYAFGGVIRDIALFGVKQFDSDIDLVYLGEEPRLNSVLSHYQITKNKYGGKRLKVGEWMIDIWRADQSWAFQNGHIKFESISSMLETTITNWDAILYRWKDKHIICKDNYFEDISKQYLDIVFETNKSYIDMYARILRWIDLNPVACTLSPELESMIATARKTYSTEQLHAKASKSLLQRRINLGPASMSKSERSP